MKKIKLSFNKNSKGDLLAVVFFVAGVLVLIGNGLGYTISNEQVSSWAGLILQILGGLGFMRNTSTGTSSTQQTNAGSERVSQALNLGLKLADTVVPELAVIVGLSKTDRKKEAIRYVNANLSKLGLDINLETASGLVEKAYQSYKVSGGDNHAPVVTPIPEGEPVATEENVGSESDD